MTEDDIDSLIEETKQKSDKLSQTQKEVQKLKNKLRSTVQEMKDQDEISQDKYDGILMMAFETVVQESVAEEEAVVAFAENFLEYCENLEEEGMIQVADSEDELRQRYEDAKDSLKQMEGRK